MGNCGEDAIIELYGRFRPAELGFAEILYIVLAFGGLLLISYLVNYLKNGFTNNQGGMPMKTKMKNNWGFITIATLYIVGTVGINYLSGALLT